MTKPDKSLTVRGFSFLFHKGDPEFPRSNTGPVSRSYVKSTRADNAAMQRVPEDTHSAAEKDTREGATQNKVSHKQ